MMIVACLDVVCLDENFSFRKKKGNKRDGVGTIGGSGWKISVKLSAKHELVHRRLCQYLVWPWIGIGRKESKAEMNKNILSKCR